MRSGFLGRKYEVERRGSALRPRRGVRSQTIVPDMTEMITAVLGATAWLGGVLVLVVMAGLPLLEHFADPDRR